MKLLEMKKALYRRLDELDVEIDALETERTKIVNEIDGLLFVSERVNRGGSAVIHSLPQNDESDPEPSGPWKLGS